LVYWDKVRSSNKLKTPLIKNNCKTKKEAFTFVELVVAMLILAVVALYIAIMMPTALLITQQTEDIAKASDLAQKYMENLKASVNSGALSFDNLTEGDTPPLSLTETISDFDYTDEGNFTVSTNVNNSVTENVIDEDTGLTTQLVTLKKFNITYYKTGNDNPLTGFTTEIARPAE
jgi:prepilin-type N-terminal cleavage/methylation domain-containing protein